jgi:YD repeat-containing protein
LPSTSSNGPILSHVTTYIYNNLDRLTQRTDALGKSDTYAYDADGNLTTFTETDAAYTLGEGTRTDQSVTPYWVPTPTSR